ncbi:hypothetical protein [Psychromonas sp.]
MSRLANQDHFYDFHSLNFLSVFRLGSDPLGVNELKIAANYSLDFLED